MPPTKAELLKEVEELRSSIIYNSFAHTLNCREYVYIIRRLRKEIVEALEFGYTYRAPLSPEFWHRDLYAAFEKHLSDLKDWEDEPGECTDKVTVVNRPSFKE